MLNLDKVRFNQNVTLTNDRAFRGYLIGVAAKADPHGVQVLVAVSEPGQTDLHESANVWLFAADLEIVSHHKPKPASEPVILSDVQIELFGVGNDA
jgi:hypothetical protein